MSDEHYDQLETRDPAQRELAQFNLLPDLVRDAMAKAPGWAAQLKGIDAGAVTSRAALGKLPVLRKSALKERGKCQFLLFQTIPDYALLRHFPRPEHYDRAYDYKDGEAPHPDNIRIFTNPWQRVGFPDFYLNTFDEIGAA